MPDSPPVNPGISPASQLKNYPTRVDAFRRSSGIDVRRWRAEFGGGRSVFLAARAGRDVSVETVARLVRSATRVLGRPVDPSELFDLGEDAPIGTPPPEPRPDPQLEARTRYDTPLDRLLLREGVKPAEVARKAGISRQTFRHLRAGVELPRVSTLRRVVAALRLLTGKPILASSLYDLGDDIREVAGE